MRFVVRIIECYASLSSNFFQIFQKLRRFLNSSKLAFPTLVKTLGYNKKRDGGEGGIRTLDTLLRCTPLAGERLRPLGHLTATGRMILMFTPIAKQKIQQN